MKFFSFRVYPKSHHFLLSLLPHWGRSGLRPVCFTGSADGHLEPHVPLLDSQMTWAFVLGPLFLLAPPPLWALGFLCLAQPLYPSCQLLRFMAILVWYHLLCLLFIVVCCNRSLLFAVKILAFRVSVRLQEEGKTATHPVYHVQLEACGEFLFKNLFNLISLSVSLYVTCVCRCQ